MVVVKGAQIADFLASDWSSDVRSHVMGGNRGPGGKRDRGLTGSHMTGSHMPGTGSDVT